MSNYTFTTQDRYALLSKGVLVEQATPKAQLEELICALRPIKTGVPLVRVGGDADGGYLVPDDLTGISACFSPGVGLQSSFESSLQRDYGIESHLCDASADGPQNFFQPKSFLKKFVGSQNTLDLITIDSWVETYESQGDSLDLMLQMDIEGAEYETLLATSIDVLRRFRIMVIEFHNIESFAQNDFFKVAMSTFRKILRSHMPVHLHPNNCCGIVNINDVEIPRVFELTLYRRDRSRAEGLVSSFPHPLDRPNLPERPDLLLPSAWYTHS